MTTITEKTHKTPVEIKVPLGDTNPQSINHPILWRLSELIALSLRINDQHQNIDQNIVDQLYLRLQELDIHLKIMSRHEGNLINFLLRDWMMHLFSQSQSEKLIQMHHILRQGEISGSIVGRKRTIHDITQNPCQLPTAVHCLNIIGQISPTYYAVSANEGPVSQLPSSAVPSTDLFTQWLIPASVIWITVTAGLLFL
ncbi:hypothetical protein N9C31_03090 [Gammaproteobacteria bacterium]|nr:hypothetical protein [Gammaproteobacteria bacterium]